MITRQSFTIRSTRCRRIDQLDNLFRKPVTMLLEARRGEAAPELGQRKTDAQI